MLLIVWIESLFSLCSGMADNHAQEETYSLADFALIKKRVRKKYCYVLEKQILLEVFQYMVSKKFK